ncbi:DUF6290 family protein [Spirochaeta dissipatitropha]
MAVVSVRLNKDEEKIVTYLADYFHEEKSTLFKKALYELYEDIQDIKFVEEHVEGRDAPNYISSEELLE